MRTRLILFFISISLMAASCSDYSCPTYEGTIFYNRDHYSPPKKAKRTNMKMKPTPKAKRAEQD